MQTTNKMLLHQQLDLRLHLRVPQTGLMAEVNASFEEVTEGDIWHVGFSPFGLCGRWRLTPTNPQVGTTGASRVSSVRLSQIGPPGLGIAQAPSRDRV